MLLLVDMMKLAELSEDTGTHLKGRKPPMAMCMGRLLYHGAGGISREMFLVRQGASKPSATFLPRIPPSTVRGKPTARERERESSCANALVYIFIHGIIEPNIKAMYTKIVNYVQM